MHPWRTFNVGDWEPAVTERELRLGAGLGANTVRMFIDYQFSLDNSRVQQPRDVYFAPVERYIENAREFLDIAGRLGLQVIVTLFDSLDWFMYQPQYLWIAEEYLKELVPPFVNDPRILCWDLQNEPDRPLALLGNNVVIPFFKRISALVRQMDPRHLQTIGWIDRARGRYFADLDDSLDFWCFHFYDKIERLNDLVQFYKTKTAKPVLLEEYGLATGGPGPDGQHSEAEQAQHYIAVMTTLEQNNMCGSVFWTLNDFPVGLAGNPPSPNDSPENHFGVFRVDHSEKPVAAEIRGFWSPQSGRNLRP
jgi:endo-1,4-beta-mannosidase